MSNLIEDQITTVAADRVLVSCADMVSCLPLGDFLNNPDFENKSKVHDWRNYIPLDIQSIWLSLSEETRLIAAYMAERQADREDWD